MSTMKLGINSKLYIRTGGNYNTPTFTEADIVNDLKQGNKWDVVDAPDRSTFAKGFAKTLMDLSFTASLKKRDDSNTLTAVLDAFNSRTGSLDCLVLDGDKTLNNARGYRFDAIVTEASEDQGTGVALYVDTEFKPDGFSSNKPQAVLVTNNSPAYTALG